MEKKIIIGFVIIAALFAISVSYVAEIDARAEEYRMQQTAPFANCHGQGDRNCQESRP